ASVTLGLTAPCVAAPKAAYIAHADIDAAAHQLSPTYTDDEPLRVIDAGAYRVGVFVVGRPRNKDAQPLSDDGAIPVSEGLALPSVQAILRILKGSGVFVTGGKLDDPVPIAADDPDLTVIGPGFRAKKILGGESHAVKEGDIVVVPAGVPHGFSAIDAPLLYEVVRIDAAKTLPLK